VLKVARNYPPADPKLSRGRLEIIPQQTRREVYLTNDPVPVTNRSAAQSDAKPVNQLQVSGRK